MRIDKLLWYLRLAPTRSFGQGLVAAGHLRLNGKRIERASTPVRPGDIVVIPGQNRARVVELIALPSRRGPAAEAQACYRSLDTPLDELAANPIAPAHHTACQGTEQP